MKKIIIKTQKEFDEIKEIKTDEEVVFKSEKIKINCVLNVFGILRLHGEIDSSWDNRYIASFDSSQNHITSWGSSQNHIASLDSSQNHITGWGSSQNHIASFDSSQNHIASFDSSQNHIESFDSSQNHIESFDSSVNTVINSITSLIMYGFSVAIIPFFLKTKIKKEKTCIVQKYKPLPYLQREGIKIIKDNIILFKKVSAEFKTQENTQNETVWNVGKTLIHPNWQPKESECGSGKYHACSKPFFCNKFRNEINDKYIAIQISVKDLYEWKKEPHYPHKIGFRKGTVLYECDCYGNKIKKV